jgi:hypothetical protein
MLILLLYNMYIASNVLLKTNIVIVAIDEDWLCQTYSTEQIPIFFFFLYFGRGWKRNQFILCRQSSCVSVMLKLAVHIVTTLLKEFYC